MASSLSRIQITFRQTTLGRTPLDEGSARRRDLWQHTTLTGDRYACSRIWTHNPSKPAAAEPSLRPRGHYDRPVYSLCTFNYFYWIYVKKHKCKIAVCAHHEVVRTEYEWSVSCTDRFLRRTEWKFCATKTFSNPLNLIVAWRRSKVLIFRNELSSKGRLSERKRFVWFRSNVLIFYSNYRKFVKFSTRNVFFTLIKNNKFFWKRF